MDINILSWIFSGGSVGIPKRLLALLDLFQLDFSSLGQLVYLFYLEGSVHEKDLKGKEAAKALEEKGLIRFTENSGEVDFSPLFEQLTQFSNQTSVNESEHSQPSVAEVIKIIEKETGYFLSLKDKQDLAEVNERYHWPNDLLHKIFLAYREKRSASYHFSFFAKMINNAGVQNEEDLSQYLKTLNYENNKVREVLRRLGKYHNPTISQEEMYYKWSKEWAFSHEMIILASDKTINATNPSFGYVDAILKEWYKNDIKSKESAEEYYQFHLGAKHKQTNKSSKIRYVNTSGYRDFSDLVE